MDNKTQRLKDLLQAASWSNEDCAWLKKYLDGDLIELESIAKNEFLKDNENFDPALTPETSLVLLNKLHQRLGINKPTKQVKLWPRIGIAAAVIGLAIGIYFFTAPRHPDNSSSRTAGRDLLANDIAPGTNAATLTLANGKKILINDAASGMLAEQHGVSISKTADGQIVYEIKENTTGTKGYNTLQTSNGEQTQVRLQDGSIVSLNAASALTYPASFAGLKERRVKLKGEGDFKVHHDEKQPFLVEARGQVVEDIGTEFNINAYDDEPVVKTTLVEGLAKVIPMHSLSASGGEMPKGQRGGEVLLKPNQQAILSADNRITVKTVDVNEAIDWKNEEFLFKNEPLDQIMRRVARWYNIEVIYTGNINRTQTFSGRVSRKRNISEVLENMQATDKINFKIEGRKVQVSN